MRSSDYPQHNIVKNAVNDLNRGHKFKPTPPPASSKPIKNSTLGLDIKPVPPPASAKPKYKDEYQRLISSPPGRPAPFPPSQSDHVEYVTFGGEVNENIYDPGNKMAFQLRLKTKAQTHNKTLEFYFLILFFNY